jgi:hypothetical protein
MIITAGYGSTSSPVNITMPWLKGQKMSIALYFALRELSGLQNKNRGK